MLKIKENILTGQLFHVNVELAIFYLYNIRINFERS